MITETMTDFRELRVARDSAALNLDALNDALDEKRDRLEQQLEAIKEDWRKRNSELLDSVEKATSKAEAADRDLRQAMIDEYRRTGNKQIDKDLKLSVRVLAKIRTLDEKARLAWAKTNAPMLVKEIVDDKAFTKIVETLDEKPDFVEVVETPSAVIGNLQ